MATVSASVARQTLPAQLDLVQGGEQVAITRHGRVVAVLVHPDLLAHHRAPQARAEADRLAVMLDAARRAPIPAAAIPAERAAELVDALRADRDR